MSAGDELLGLPPITNSKAEREHLTDQRKTRATLAGRTFAQQVIFYRDIPVSRQTAFLLELDRTGDAKVAEFTSIRKASNIPLAPAGVAPLTLAEARERLGARLAPSPSAPPPPPIDQWWEETVAAATTPPAPPAGGMVEYAKQLVSTHVPKGTTTRDDGAPWC